MPTMRKAYFAMALSVLVTLVYGATQSKVETELRARLAAAESARVLALQDKAAMTATVARLTKAREQSANGVPVFTCEAVLGDKFLCSAVTSAHPN